MDLKDRLNWDEYVCLLALAASSRSEDPFSAVGAALLDVNGNVLGTGTNGLKRGMVVPEWMSKEENRSQKSDLMIHSEVNLWMRKKEGEEFHLGLTMNPCKSCAQLISGSKVKRIVYLKPYEKGTDDFKTIFDFYGIEYYQLPQASVYKVKRVLMEKLNEY